VALRAVGGDRRQLVLELREGSGEQTAAGFEQRRDRLGTRALCPRRVAVGTGALLTIRRSPLILSTTDDRPQHVFISC
jgi:hypothetical protein